MSLPFQSTLRFQLLSSGRIGVEVGVGVALSVSAAWGDGQSLLLSHGVNYLLFATGWYTQAQSCPSSHMSELLGIYTVLAALLLGLGLALILATVLVLVLTVNLNRVVLAGEVLARLSLTL
jgi:hypothetical protein